MRFRLSDKEAYDTFRKSGVPLHLETITVAGRHIHYAVAGDSTRPTLLFVHGSPGSWSAFDKYMQDKDLLSRFRMISVDRPGFGYSDYGHAIPISQQSEMMGELFIKINNGKPLYAIGHSLGGPLVTKLAAHYPQYINGLVLLAASVDPNEEKPEKWRPIMKAFPLRYFLPGAFRPSNIELWAFKKDVKTMPADLEAITCPVLIIQGMQDPLVPPGNAFYAQKKLIHARSVTLDTLSDANHFIPWTRFEIIKKHLLQLQ